MDAVGPCECVKVDQKKPPLFCRVFVDNAFPPQVHMSTMRVLSLLLLAISVCTGREHHHSLDALKPHSVSTTMNEPTYHELKIQISKLERENEILKAQGMERAGDAQVDQLQEQLRATCKLAESAGENIDSAKFKLAQLETNCVDETTPVIESMSEWYKNVPGHPCTTQKCTKN